MFKTWPPFIIFTFYRGRDAQNVILFTSRYHARVCPQCLGTDAGMELHAASVVDCSIVDWNLLLCVNRCTDVEGRGRAGRVWCTWCLSLSADMIWCSWRDPVAHTCHTGLAEAPYL